MDSLNTDNENRSVLLADLRPPQPRDDGLRKQLLSFIRGTRVVIPDLQSMTSHWPTCVNADIDRLGADVRSRLESILSAPEDQKRLAKMKETNFALFGASWWSYSTRYEALRIATYLAIWLFLWDDETDSVEYSDLTNDFEGACAFRRETLAYVEACLSPDSQAHLPLISTNRFITNFSEVGKALRESYTERQIEAFLDEVRRYINMCEEEQRWQVSAQLPPADEYIRRRMGSSAVGITMGLMEYAYGIDLGDSLRSNPILRAMLEEANLVTSISNDILSIKKEIDNGQTDSLVPLLTLQLGSVQKAIDQAVKTVRSSIARIDALEKEILEEYSSDGPAREAIGKFIGGCKIACTANTNWTLQSPRYKLHGRSVGGVLEVVL
ncbi:isoprenoid synthase domain-containing protein [Xylaria grammica]|nr:isoprenoid synthase domain-containing protein [Xylaria grammica]